MISGKQSISIDMDDVLYDFVGRLLDKYNAKYEDNVKIDAITDWKIQQFLKPECKDIFSEFATDELFDEIELSERTKRALTYVNDRHELTFLTSGRCSTMVARENLLSRNLPWFKSEQLVRMVNKYRFSSLYHIDDAPHNVENGIYYGVLFARPWNREYREKNKKVLTIRNLDEFCSIISK